MSYIYIVHACAKLTQDKKIRGKFPVPSIAFVEEIQPGTFGGVKFGFQVSVMQCI